MSQTAIDQILNNLYMKSSNLSKKARTRATIYQVIDNLFDILVLSSAFCLSILTGINLNSNSNNQSRTVFSLSIAISAIKGIAVYFNFKKRSIDYMNLHEKYGELCISITELKSESFTVKQSKYMDLIKSFNTLDMEYYELNFDDSESQNSANSSNNSTSNTGEATGISNDYISVV